MDAKTENRNQIIAMLFQNMSKKDAADTLTLIDNYVDKCQKAYASQQMPSEKKAFDYLEDLLVDNPNCYNKQHQLTFKYGFRTAIDWLKSLQQEKEDSLIQSNIPYTEQPQQEKGKPLYTVSCKICNKVFKTDIGIFLGQLCDDCAKHEQPPQEGLHKIECSECHGIFMSPNPKETKCKGCEEGLKK